MAGIATKMKGLHIPDVDPDKPYPMNEPNMGHALIINNVEMELKGSMVDVEAMSSAFKQVGFQVRIEKNCTKLDMARLKRWIMDDSTHKGSNCFALAMICHGDEQGFLLDVNKSKAWRVEDIATDLGVVDTLYGKPKILIFNACRGQNWSGEKRFPRGHLGPTFDVETPSILPDKVDMFLAYATVPGYIAHGGGESGSHYLQALAAYLSRHYMQRDLTTIYDMVNQYMSEIKQGDEGFMQCPQYTTSSRYKLRFSEFHKASPAVQQPASQEPKTITPAITNLKVAEPPITKAPTQKEEILREVSGKKNILSRIKMFEQSDSKVQVIPDKMEVAKPLSKLTTRTTHTSAGATPRQIDIKLLSTYDTALPFWASTKFTVMESGMVVLWGKTSETASPTFQLYQSSSAELKHMRGLNGFCDHANLASLLPVKLKNKELLAASCVKCSVIKLLDFDSKSVTTGFKEERYFPGYMCKGDGDVLYVVNFVKGDKSVLELNIGQSPFTGPTKTIECGVSALFGLHYVPFPHKLLVFYNNSNPSYIRAVSADTGKKVWEVTGEVDGKTYSPHGLLFSQQHEILLVADGSNHRFIVLHPRDGSHLQTINLDPDVRDVYELGFHDNKLIVHHHIKGKHKVSFFSIYQ